MISSPSGVYFVPRHNATNLKRNAMKRWHSLSPFQLSDEQLRDHIQNGIIHASPGRAQPTIGHSGCETDATG